MSFLPSSPGTTNLPDIFQRYPKRAVLMLELIDDILRGESALSVGERELIFAYGSAQNSCDFCYASHKPVAAAFGIDETVFDRIHDDIDSAPVDERLKPILKFVRKLTLTPGKMVAVDAEAIFAAGWDERAFFDVVSVCAIQNFFNRVVDGTGVDVSADVARATGGELLPTIGYRGIADQLKAHVDPDR